MQYGTHRQHIRTYSHWHFLSIHTVWCSWGRSSWNSESYLCTYVLYVRTYVHIHIQAHAACIYMHITFTWTFHVCFFVRVHKVPVEVKPMHTVCWFNLFPAWNRGEHNPNIVNKVGCINPMVVFLLDPPQPHPVDDPKDEHRWTIINSSSNLLSKWSAVGNPKDN